MQPPLYNQVQTYRKKHYLTQADLAALVNVTRQTIISIEKGNYVPSVLLAIRLAAALNCSVGELFYETK